MEMPQLKAPTSPTRQSTRGGNPLLLSKRDNTNYTDSTRDVNTHGVTNSSCLGFFIHMFECVLSKNGLSVLSADITPLNTLIRESSQQTDVLLMLWLCWMPLSTKSKEPQGSSGAFNFNKLQQQVFYCERPESWTNDGQGSNHWCLLEKRLRRYERSHWRDKVNTPNVRLFATNGQSWPLCLIKFLCLTLPNNFLVLLAHLTKTKKQCKVLALYTCWM